MTGARRTAACAEEALAVLGLVWISGALWRVFEDPYGREWVYAVAAGAAAWAIWQRRALWPAVRAAWPALLLVALAVLSTFWSVKPSRTERAASALFVTTCIGLFLATRFDLRRQLRIAALSFGGLAAATLVLVTVAPGIALMTGLHEGAWQGPFSNRQFLAPLAALGGVACMLCALEWPEWRRLAWFGAALCLVAVLGSRSRSGGITALAVAAAIPALLALRGVAAERRRAWLLGGSALAILATGTALLFPEFVLEPLGRDLSLSGRTEIWRLALDAARTRPWLGFGYDVFWSWNEVWPALTLEVGYYIAHGHSAWVDLALDLGVVGVALFTGGALLAATRAARFAFARPEPAALWPLLGLGLLLAMSLVESTLKFPTSSQWALYVALAVAASGDDAARPEPGNTPRIPASKSDHEKRPAAE